jgi:hypothetical protein
MLSLPTRQSMPLIALMLLASSLSAFTASATYSLRPSASVWMSQSTYRVGEDIMAYWDLSVQPDFCATYPVTATLSFQGPSTMEFKGDCSLLSARSFFLGKAQPTWIGHWQVSLFAGAGCSKNNVCPFWAVQLQTSFDVVSSPPPTPTCPDGQYWNGAQCVCPSGQEWNGQQCVTPPPPTPTCPDGQYWNGAQCVCPSGQEWNGQQCVTPPPPTPTCQDGQYWNGAQCTCPSGQQWNGQQCATPSCQYGGTYPNCNPQPTCQYGGTYPHCNPAPNIIGPNAPPSGGQTAGVTAAGAVVGAMAGITTTTIGKIAASTLGLQGMGAAAGLTGTALAGSILIPAVTSGIASYVTTTVTQQWGWTKQDSFIASSMVGAGIGTAATVGVLAALGVAIPPLGVGMLAAVGIATAASVISSWVFNFG